MKKLFEKKRYADGKREIFFLGKRIFNYHVKKVIFDLVQGIVDYEHLPITENLPKEKDKKYPEISLIYPVYYQHDDFSEFYSVIQKYDKEYSNEIKEKMEIIIVDDGSLFPVSLPDCNLNISLLRVDKDISWNNSGARNLGACYASTPKLFMCDIDWFVPEETIKTCIEAELTDKDLLVFKAVVIDKTGVHPNIYACTKKCYMSFNGYDEYYCGTYGEDIPFRKRISSLEINFIRVPLPIYFYEGKEEHHLSRSLDEIIKKMKTSKIYEINSKGGMLNFPWHVVETHKLR